MRSRKLAIGLAVLAAFMVVDSALAYYNPSTGRFLNRDPIGEPGAVVLRQAASGGFIPRDPLPNQMHLYRYVGNRPTLSIDPFGLEESTTQPSSQPCCDYCGPDVTTFLRNLVLSGVLWRNSYDDLKREDAINWFKNNGMNLDWWSSSGPYKTKNCPSGDKCKNTYWLCGECVHDHWIGNFMYGFVGMLVGLSDQELIAAGWGVQVTGSGYQDPPWDRAGYHIGFNTFEILLRTNAAGLRDDKGFCRVLKAKPLLWKIANNTAAKPPLPIGLKYPPPHADSSKYKDCEKCPESLPKDVQDLVPGGKFGKDWPKIGAG